MLNGERLAAIRLLFLSNHLSVFLFFRLFGLGPILSVLLVNGFSTLF